MIKPLPLRCSCGKVRGALVDVTPDNGNHVVCYCDDCQAFARFLGTEGVMDARGGTEIFQSTPSQLLIAEGFEQLRLVRLSEKGLLRWYTACCRSPVANMLSSPRSPFVGVFCRMMAPESREEHIGPVIEKIHGRFAIGGCPPGVHPRASLSLILRSVIFLGRGAMAGKHRPSVFFDPKSGKPVIEAQVLSAEERAALR